MIFGIEKSKMRKKLFTSVRLKVPVTKMKSLRPNMRQLKFLQTIFYAEKKFTEFATLIRKKIILLTFSIPNRCKVPSSFSFFLFEINTKELTLTGVFRWNCFLKYWFSGQRMLYSQLINTIFLKPQCRFFQLGHYFSHILIILIQVRRNTNFEGVPLKQDFVVKGSKNWRIDFFAHLCITFMWMSI